MLPIADMMETKEMRKNKFSFEKKQVNVRLVEGQILNSAKDDQRSPVEGHRLAAV